MTKNNINIKNIWHSSCKMFLEKNSEKLTIKLQDIKMFILFLLTNFPGDTHLPKLFKNFPWVT